MAAKKKAGTISKLRKAMAKDVASLKANHRRDAAALKKQAVAARKRAFRWITCINFTTTIKNCSARCVAVVSRY